MGWSAGTPLVSGRSVGRRARSPRVQEWHKCARLFECKRGTSEGIASCLRYADTSRSAHRQASAYRRLRCFCRGLAHPLGEGLTVVYYYTLKNWGSRKRERLSASSTTTRGRNLRISLSFHYHAPPESKIFAFLPLPRATGF